MARRIILDTGTLIAIERGKLDVDAVLGLDDAAIASATAMELLVRVERADEARNQARSVRVEAVLASLPIEDYTLAVARIHARLAVQAMSTGKPKIRLRPDDRRHRCGNEPNPAHHRRQSRVQPARRRPLRSNRRPVSRRRKT